MSDLRTQLAQLAKGLVYVTETDAGVQVVPTKIELVDPVQFFARLVTETGFDAESDADARRWQHLQKFLQANCTQLFVAKAGTVERDVYIVGITAEGEVLTLKTFAVET